jgi:hypothetical protein
MYIPSNALDLFEKYKNYYQKNEIPASLVGKTQIALLHCVVPALGGPKPKGKRSTKDDIKAAMDFLKGISLEQLLNTAESVIVFLNEENITKTKQREYWTYVKKLIKWASEQQYIINSLPNVIDKPSEDPSFSTKGEIQVKGKNLKMSGEQATPKYTIGCHSGDYITLTLHNQLEDYRKFLIEDRGLCDDIKSSVDANITNTNLLLGWLHREKNIPLDDLCLESIIPLLRKKPERAEFKDANGVVNQKAYLAAKKELEKQAREHSDKTILLVKSFLDVYSKALSTRLNVLAAIINIAKYVYRNDTNTKIARNYEDIQIIELLREVRRYEINNFKMMRKTKSKRPKQNITLTKDKVCQ